MSRVLNPKVIIVLAFVVFFVNLILFFSMDEQPSLITQYYDAHNRTIIQETPAQKTTTPTPEIPAAQEIAEQPPEQILEQTLRPIQPIRVPISSHLNRTGIPVLVFCYNRPGYLSITLQSVFKALPTTGEYSVYITQQGNLSAVTEVIRKYTDAKRAYWIRFNFDKVPEKLTLVQMRKLRVPFPYHVICMHYKWALNYILNTLDYPRVIVLEDDLPVSIDFFSYFTMGWNRLMSKDPSIYSISACNDFGLPAFVADSRQLYRSDYFPQLGWLLTQTLFMGELLANWPLYCWDDWMRSTDQTRNRSTVRPEINRVLHIGAKGTSGGANFKKKWKFMRLNAENVDWSDAALDLSYLLGARNYDTYLKPMVTGRLALDVDGNAASIASDSNSNKSLNTFIFCESAEILRRQSAAVNPLVVDVIDAVQAEADEAATIPAILVLGTNDSIAANDSAITPPPPPPMRTTMVNVRVNVNANNISNFVIPYADYKDLKIKFTQVGLLYQQGAGIPRMSYRGIVAVRWKGHRLFFVPSNLNWNERITPVPNTTII